MNEHSTRHASGRVSSLDGLELVWQSWIPERPAGVIAIIHGLAEHGGRYRDTATWLAARGWAVYTCDLRSHGLSPDLPGAGRVHVNRFAEFLLDADALVSLASRNHPDLPLYLLGHSMGGLITILYALQNPGKLAGTIVSSPALGTHPEFKPPLFLKLMVSVLSRLAPRLRVDSGLDTDAISRDPAVVKAYRDDPLVSNRVSTRWYSEIIRSMKRAHREAHRLQVPMLLMQSGADRLVDPAAPARWAESAPDGLVETMTWDGFYHEMLNEPQREQVREKILQWLSDQADP